MSANSKIEWTDATWNPVRGCTKISPGCLHCYAETFAERFRGVPGHPFEFGFDLRLVPEKLGDPLRWSTSRKIFVNSMSDLFHEKVPDEYIVKVARVMKAANWHTATQSSNLRGACRRSARGKKLVGKLAVFVFRVGNQFLMAQSTTQSKSSSGNSLTQRRQGAKTRRITGPDCLLIFDLCAFALNPNFSFTRRLKLSVRLAAYLSRAENPACSKCLSPVSAPVTLRSRMMTKETQSVSVQPLSACW
jgi:hypothetical protein